MADSATTLISGALGEGYAGLSSRQLLMCLLAVYGAGLRASDAIAGAVAAGYTSLSDRQLDQCLLKTFQG